LNYRFVDETVLEVESGAGGPGHISFHREKYIARGGPDGGDGGRGGDVIFVVRSNLKTLIHLKKSRSFKAQNGEAGQKRNRHGSDGKNAYIPVPPGTIVRDAENDEILRDLTEEGQEWLFLKGGMGGRGNARFATASFQAPRFAQPGMPGALAKVHIELNLIADIGFVGFPNAGKSSLLGALSNAHPRIADYPFTTITPNLGMMRRGEVDVVLADIPGIIEGASHGIGLGLRFLKHVARTKGLAFLIDLSDPGFLGKFDVLKAELGSYSPELEHKQRVIVGTKLDLPGTGEALQALAEALPGEKIFGISVHAAQGIEELRREFMRMASHAGEG
jgi:GTPase